MSLIAPQSRRSAAETAAGGTQFWPRVPPNFFGIPFGLAGLAEAWYAASPTLGTSAVVPDAIDIVAAVAWLADWPVDRRRRGPGEVSPPGTSCPRWRAVCLRHRYHRRHYAIHWSDWLSYHDHAPSRPTAGAPLATSGLDPLAMGSGTRHGRRIPGLRAVTAAQPRLRFRVLDLAGGTGPGRANVHSEELCPTSECD